MIHAALILTAGLGTRLRPLTDVRAKPAIPVAGEPMIRRIIRWLAGWGVTDLVLNLHYRPDTLTAVVGDGADLSVRVRYSWEQPLILGSAGGPRLALPLVGADTFLIVNGDTLTDLDLAALAGAHAASGARVTLALVPNREVERYGGVLLDPDGRVRGFTPRGPAAAGSYHFVGVQAAQASVFEPLPAGVAARSIGGAYDALMARDRGAVRGFVCDAPFWDVGTPIDYWRMSVAFASGAAIPAAPVPQRAASDPLSIGLRARIDSTARLTRSIVWDDVQVGADAAVDECIVTDGVAIPAGARYRRTILVGRDDGGVSAFPIAGFPDGPSHL